MKRKYDSAESLFYAMVGCGCCNETNVNFEYLKDTIIKEYVCELIK